ncbi:MAG: hypothetical protein AAF928_19150 [Myxococcota bacterium]
MTRRPLVAALVATSVLPAAALAAGGFAVKEGPETCANAHAVVVASRTADHDVVWGEIGKVIRRKPQRFRVRPDYEPGVVGSISLRQYDLEYVEGGSAYVAHCGHGGTCNQLVRDFFAEHDDWYSPEVFCGAVPDGLDNGRAVDIE